MAGGRSMSALPGIVRAPATGLVRGRVIARLIGIWRDAAADICRGERTVVRPSLSVIPKDRIGLAERDELLSRIWVFVHVRVELLAQLVKGGLDLALARVSRDGQGVIVSRCCWPRGGY